MMKPMAMQLMLISSFSVVLLTLSDAYLSDNIFADAIRGPLLKKRALVVLGDMEDCVSSFPSSSSFNMGIGSSNFKCQTYCRDKGFVLAATQRQLCYCGNDYPEGKRVDKAACSIHCSSWHTGPCSPLSACCGGPSAYALSSVGDLNVPKQILRRLTRKWRATSAFKDYAWSLIPSKAQLPVGIKIRIKNISHKDMCLAVTSHSGLIGAECTPEWKDQVLRINKITNSNYFKIEGKGNLCLFSYASEEMNQFNCNVEAFKDQHWEIIPAPKPGNRYMLKGYVSKKCAYMHANGRVGVYECNPEFLDQWWTFAIEEPSEKHWKSRPVMEVRMKNLKGVLQQCSMKSSDISPESTTFECKPAEGPSTSSLVLTAKKFDIEDKSPVAISKPEPIPNVPIYRCPTSNMKRKCTHTFAVSLTKGSSYSVGTGFSVEATVTVGTEVSAGFLGSGATSTFEAAVSSGFSMSSELSKYEDRTVTTSVSTAVEVPPGHTVQIQLNRQKQDVVYKWKGIFQQYGVFTLRYANGFTKAFDISQLLQGLEHYMYSFGTYKYPDQDTLVALVTGTDLTGCNVQSGSKGFGAKCKSKKQ